MITRNLVMLLGVCSFGLNATPAFGTFLPPNMLHLQDDVNKNANIDETLFNQIIDQVLDVYEPIINDHGATLVRNRFWDDATVNAYAAQEGTNWVVSMYGGLARRDEVTPDGFAMVVCHELGHHLAGFPLKGERWASSEGQADYFATHECARKIWADEEQTNAGFRESVLPFVQEQCDAAWDAKADQDLCYRTAVASESLANLLAALGSAASPSFETPDTSEVVTTYEAHPQAQCRLDTYFAAALCGKSFDTSFIPGKNHPQGQASEDAELSASQVSCMKATGDVFGNRPRCWYGPQLEFLALYREGVHMDELQGNGNSVLEPGEVFGMTYTLSNRTNVETTGVSGVVTGTGPFAIVSGEQITFDNIAPGQTVTNHHRVELAVAEDLPCGSKGDIKLTATSDQGGANLLDPMIVGAAETVLGGSNNTALAIPNDATVYTEITATQDILATRAMVSVDIDHNYTSDVMLYLISPTGEEFFIRRLPRSTENKIVATYPIALPQVATSGTWQLKVQDTYRLDDGTLNEWKLEFEHYVCE